MDPTVHVAEWYTPCSPLKVANISKEYIASIFRVEESDDQEISGPAYHPLSHWFLARHIFRP
jgi:hypothetical protein